MKFDDIAPECRIAYAIHQRLLALGFRADALFVGINRGRLIVTIGQVTEDRQPPFVIECGDTKLSQDEFTVVWDHFVDELQVKRSISEEDRVRCYNTWTASDVALVHALMMKGLLPSQSGEKA